MKTHSRKCSFPRRPLALALAFVIAPAALGQNLPTGFALKWGAVDTPATSGQTMTLAQHSKGAIIEWGTFNIGNGYHVDFQQPGSDSVTLNRVTGGSLSQINGMLTANGRVFVVNSQGIMFGSTSQINVGGLVASTLDIADDKFETGVTSGSYVFLTGVAQQNTVENDGQITANPGGSVVLLGGRVLNGNGTDNATISAPQGTVAFGVGSQITLDIGGDGLTQLRIDASAFNGNGTYAVNSANGKLVADGGQVLMQALSSVPTKVVNNGIVQARSMTSRAGHIVLSSASDDGISDQVNVQGGTLDVSGNAAGVRGGAIELSGYNISVLGLTCFPFCEELPPPPTPSLIDASGSAGGSISINAYNVTEVDRFSTLNANAGNNGNGGSVIVNGMNGLYAFGRFSAEGGVNGGDGGLVDTSGGGVSMGGIQASVKAPRGTAGRWLIDPHDVTIVHGNAAGTLPTNPFDPIMDSTIQDGDINNALNGGTNVTITTGTGGLPGAGNIYMDGTILDPVTGLALAVDILRSTGNAPVTFRLDANEGIGGDNFTIHSNVGPLNVIFDSDANGNNGSRAPMQFANATILTNGGDLSMYGQNDPLNGAATSVSNQGIELDGVKLDTRVGGSDANVSGNILLRGRASCTPAHDCQGFAIVRVLDSNLFTSTGSIDVEGVNGAGVQGAPGVVLDTSNASGPGTVLRSTSGAITVVGVSSGAGGSAGLILGVANVQSTGGVIDLRGHGAVDGTDGNGAPVFNYGLDISEAANLSSASGLVLLSGSSDGSGAGVNVDAGATVGAGSGNIVVRAHNNGSTDALVLGGTLDTSGVIDVRPGGVDVTGALVENQNDAIVLGGTTGFALSTPELGNLTATTLVLGSSVQAAAISVPVPVSYAHNLTLQGGAGIAINGALNVGGNTLALIGAGNITQAAPITAASLLVDSSAAAVILTNAANQVSANTLAGSAAGNFSVVNAGSVGIGNVTATGFNAAVNTPAALAGTGVNGGGDVLVRALNGDMILGANVNGNNVDLVSNGVFDNTGRNTITAAGNWQVWGNTWAGENRAGLAGNGNLPNLYGCTFGGACGVTPSTTANQFIYTVRPLATITFTNSSREYGLANATINYGVNGLILGDQAGNAINGNVVTAATQASNVGNYAIGGNFVSPAGYALNVLPGVLAVTPATLVYAASPFDRLYGDPNGTLAGTVTGFRLTDTLASATTGAVAFTTGATQASNVGQYTINGSGLTATNYVFAQAPANATALRINPASLFYVAAPFTRLYGDPNGPLTGTVTGFRLADTLTNATSGTIGFTSSATQASNVGQYAINGSGLNATNYVFLQAVGNAAALRIDPATLVYVANPLSRLYGDPNGTLAGTVSGFRLADTQANATTGSVGFVTSATQASNVGQYAIDGSGLVAANYVFAQAPGNAVALRIDPATLFYDADPKRRMVGTPNGDLAGTVSGFRNGDTQATATTGSLTFQTMATANSPAGTYAINGAGLLANNYLFVQDPTNALALTITPPFATYTLDVLRDTPVTYVYDSNFGIVGLCPANDLAAGSREQDGDTLSREWSRVRSRPNLANCVSTRQKDSCGDF
ncbi:MAG: MBG domain-containing protein [Rhodanobacter sp.]